MKTRVSVTGLRELDRALGELSKASANGVLRRIGLKALQPVADTMAALAPDDPATGGNDLRSSIGVGTKLSRRQAQQNRKREDKSFVEVYAGAGPLPQAHLQEFGTVNHPPQPFARPAWAENKDRVLEIVKSDLGDEIIKTARRVAKRAAAKALRG